jgi:enterochelin esterase-like enzyme
VSRNRGQLVTETLSYAGGRDITAYVPPSPPEAVVFVADGGWHASNLVEVLSATNTPRVMIVGVHERQDDEGRFGEYVPVVDAERFAAHEKFFVEDVRGYVSSSFGVALPAQRTAVWGASLGGELALALGVRHPDAYGAVFCASPGGGYRPRRRCQARSPGFTSSPGRRSRSFSRARRGGPMRSGMRARTS